MIARYQKWKKAGLKVKAKIGQLKSAKGVIKDKNIKLLAKNNYSYNVTNGYIKRKSTK